MVEWNLVDGKGNLKLKEHESRAISIKFYVFGLVRAFQKCPFQCKDPWKDLAPFEKNIRKHNKFGILPVSFVWCWLATLFWDIQVNLRWRASRKTVPAILALTNAYAPQPSWYHTSRYNVPEHAATT